MAARPRVIDRIGVDRRPMLRPVVVGQRLPQLHLPGEMGVALWLVERRSHSGPHGGSRRSAGLADLEMHHAPTRRLLAVGQRVDFHRIEGPQAHELVWRLGHGTWLDDRPSPLNQI